MYWKWINMPKIKCKDEWQHKNVGPWTMDHQKIHWLNKYMYDCIRIVLCNIQSKHDRI